MKNEQIQEFFTKVAQDEGFKAEVLKFKEEMEAKKLNEQDVQKFVGKVLLPKAKKLGYDFSEKDLADFGNSQGMANLDKLSLEEMKNVSGGVNKGLLGAIFLLAMCMGVGVADISAAAVGVPLELNEVAVKNGYIKDADDNEIDSVDSDVSDDEKVEVVFTQELIDFMKTAERVDSAIKRIEEREQREQHLKDTVQDMQERFMNAVTETASARDELDFMVYSLNSAANCAWRATVSAAEEDRGSSKSFARKVKSFRDEAQRHLESAVSQDEASWRCMVDAVYVWSEVVTELKLYMRDLTQVYELLTRYVDMYPNAYRQLLKYDGSGDVTELQTVMWDGLKEGIQHLQEIKTKLERVSDDLKKAEAYQLRAKDKLQLANDKLKKNSSMMVQAVNKRLHNRINALLAKQSNATTKQEKERFERKIEWFAAELHTTQANVLQARIKVLQNQIRDSQSENDYTHSEEFRDVWSGKLAPYITRLEELQAELDALENEANSEDLRG